MIVAHASPAMNVGFSRATACSSVAVAAAVVVQQQYAWLTGTE
jgi:hypothetical protein